MIAALVVWFAGIGLILGLIRFAIRWVAAADAPAGSAADVPVPPAEAPPQRVPVAETLQPVD